MAKRKTPDKSFNQWTQQQVEKTFGLVLLENHPLLQTWLDIALPAELEISIHELAILKELQKVAKIFVESWTEQEMVMKYVSFITTFAYLSSDNYQTFADRSLSVQVGNEKLFGRVDFMVASGRYEPEAPYFCFHEYKRAKPGHESDPVGQLLATMLAAQALNESKQPIYGAYIIGKFWQFVILEHQEYAISKSYDSTDEPLWDIMRILKGLNLLIPAMIEGRR